MKYRRVGASGLTVSVIGHGAGTAVEQAADEDQAIACVHAALDAGVTLFDVTCGSHVTCGSDITCGSSTSRTEVLLGRALGRAERDAVVISGVVGGPLGPAAAAGPCPRSTRKNVMRSAEASLRRLGTDYLDLLLAQPFDRFTPLEETLLAMADLARQGKVLYFGVSDWTAEHLVRAGAIAADLDVPLVANASHYSLLWRVIESQVIAACERAGIGQLARAPLGHGLLTGRYGAGRPPEPGSPAAQALQLAAGTDEEVLERLDRAAEIAADAGMALMQLAIAWAIQNEAVSTALVGAVTAEQVVQNCAAADLDLDLDLVTTLDLVLGRAVQTDPRLSLVL